MRQNYSATGLDLDDLAGDWWTQFRGWLADAVAAEIPEPNAMVLATASLDGKPSSRTVLAKGFDPEGVVFYTNYQSAKSRDIAKNPAVSATFPWIGLHRQVHFRGAVEPVPADVTAAYWATRPRGSQLGAWASPQSEVIEDRRHLDDLQAQVEARFESTELIPVPPHWGGWLIRPDTVEFWQGRTARLHDRLRYRRIEKSSWAIERLAP